MLLHYFKVGIRQLMKHRTQTVISVLGIAAGLLCFSVCSYYSRIMNAGNKDLATYERLAEIRTIDSANPSDRQADYQINISPKDFHDKISAEYYEAMAFYINSSSRVYLDDDSFYQIKQISCNSDYFKVFPTRCVSGSMHGFDLSQEVVVVTTDFVKKYCGNKFPIGKSIRKENGESYTIIAVIQTYPVGMNHYPETYDVFFPLEKNFNYGQHKLLLKEPKDAQRLSQQLVKVNIFPNKPEWTPYIMLESQMEHKSGAELWIAILGLLVLLTSMTNFFSFSVGSFTNRCKELSLRDTLGGKPAGMFIMLFIEQSIIILLGTLVTLVATETLLPWIINALPNEARSELAINISLLWKYMGQYLVLLLLLSALIAALSTWHISRQVTAQGMRGGTITGRRHVIRNILLGFQFFFSLLFIIGISGMQLQMRAYNNRANSQMSIEEKENIVMLDLRGNQRIESNFDEFTEYLRSRRWNDKMAYISRNYWRMYDCLIEISLVSDDYFELMKLEKRHKTDEPFCYVNPALKQEMCTDSTPDIFRYDNLVYPVKGVVNLEPDSPSAKCFAVLPLPTDVDISKIYLRIVPGANRKEVIADLSNEMNKYLPVNRPYEFVTLYDEQTGMMLYTLMGLFVVCSVICMLITILGVYGAISIDTSRRQKEVAIRKINGAKLSDIYWISGKTYLWLFLVSSVLSMAVVLFVLIMGSQHNIILFSYTNPWLWIIPLTVMGAVITCTISWNIYHISRVNPAEIIKNE